MSQKSLSLHTVIGFGGKVSSGLHHHPNKKHIIYPLGSTLILKNLLKESGNAFLQGHNGPITCISVSKSGKYIASGQQTHMGFKASIIVWDFETREIMHKLVLHKVKVQSLCFSPDEKYLLSIGGQDDNNITVWDVVSGKPLCGAVSTNLGLCASFFNTTSKFFITGGQQMLRVWEINFKTRKLIPTDCKLGQIKRNITCIRLDEEDNFAYCGSTSGDLLAVQMKGPKNFKYSGPKKRISKGILSVSFTPKGNILLGGGDGSLSVLSGETLLKKKSIKLMGAVTSISATGGGSYYVGTSQSVIYFVNSKLQPTLVSSCHSNRINDICYPDGTSEIVATCSINDIRIWNALKGLELVRIEVPNLECNCVAFSHNGKIIVSGWSDGKIRAFGPQSGKLYFDINDAHKITGQKKVSGNSIGVTALAFTKDDKRLISGGSDGQVRVWNIGTGSQVLISSMKEHKTTINCIKVSKDDSECITASDDGSCIVWNLEKFIRSNIMYAQTYFKQICYLDDESQILTAGSDKQITYWDAYNCKEIRELEGSTNEIHALDISYDGNYFICGGKDKTVTMWDYDEGEVVSQGIGHSGDITQLRYSPGDNFVASVATEGAIMIWKVSS